MYRLKGTQKGHELFFRILFNQVSETFYPREQMLRVSDGQFDTQKVLRSFSTIGDASDLVGRKIIGETSAATAIVESVKKFVVLNDSRKNIIKGRTHQYFLIRLIFKSFDKNNIIRKFQMPLNINYLSISKQNL